MSDPGCLSCALVLPHEQVAVFELASVQILSTSVITVASCSIVINDDRAYKQGKVYYTLAV
jgi:hypothetical protein